jgi:hypothetical protein
MVLPKLTVPKYKLKLPSDNRTVTYRPFLVKEEKLLLLATQTGQQEDIVNAISEIIKECTDIIDVKTLATFDIEYVFLQIRTKSVGENVEVSVTCSDDDETEVQVSIPLDEIKVKKTRGHKTEIKLDENVIITMGYPDLNTFVRMNFEDDDDPLQQVFDMAATCVKTIADENQVYDCKDISKKELSDWFEQLNNKQFKEIQKFFETMPKLSHTVKVTNPNTGKEQEILIEGLASFFA